MKAPSRYRFRLYIAGDSANAAESLANLEAFCAARLQGDYAIEVDRCLLPTLNARWPKASS